VQACCSAAETTAVVQFYISYILSTLDVVDSVVFNKTYTRYYYKIRIYMFYYINIIVAYTRGLHACEIISLEHAILDTVDPTHKRVYILFLFNNNILISYVLYIYIYIFTHARTSHTTISTYIYYRCY